ncbi:MAG: histidinol-phosphate transaminase [Candidatus Hydrogenedentota bacterium]
MKYQREILRDLQGYTPGEQPQGGHVIKLNTNENPYPPSPAVVEAYRNLTPDQLRRYPDPVAAAFRAVCADRYGTPGPDWIIGGNGMDELLSLALRTFVDPGDDVLAMHPTYSLYEVLVRLHGANLVSVDLDADFGLTHAFFNTPARLAFFTRPNAPTGLCAPREEVVRFCETFKGIVVIDEAYVDFADDDCMDLPQRFDHVIVMRSFSKSFSLAGMRIGVAVAHPELIAEFLKTKDSYNMDVFSQVVGYAAMSDYETMRANAQRVRATRTSLVHALRKLGFEVGDSQANFVLAHWNRPPGARALFEQLRERGILVRYLSDPRLENAIRISVGTDEECDALLAALPDIVG